MRKTSVLTATALALLMGAGSAFAQVNSSVGEGRAEGQLSPEQAEIISDPGNDAPSTTANVPTGENARGVDTDLNQIDSQGNVTAVPPAEPDAAPYTSAEAEAEQNDPALNDGIVDLSPSTVDPAEGPAGAPGSAQ